MSASVQMPRRVAALPRDRHGRPVPWFAVWIDGQPEVRVASGEKRVDAMRFGRCWVCGGQVGRNLAFVIGPMCAVNRVTAEPPTHRDCAEYSVQVCPFLSRPDMVRRTTGLPEGLAASPGIPILRNPGVSLLWITRSWRPFSDGRGGILIHLGDPVEVSWWREGRFATRGDVLLAFAAGLPALQEMADQEGPEAAAALARQHADALQLVPA